MDPLSRAAQTFPLANVSDEGGAAFFTKMKLVFSLFRHHSIPIRRLPLLLELYFFASLIRLPLSQKTQFVFCTVWTNAY